MDSEDRQAVVEGLAKIVAAVQPAAAVSAALQLLTPVMQRIQSVAEAISSSGAISTMMVDMMAAELHLVATVLMQLQSGPNEDLQSGPHPAIQVLEAAWPTLVQLAHSPLCQQHAQVRNASSSSIHHFPSYIYVFTSDGGLFSVIHKLVLQALPS